MTPEQWEEFKELCDRTWNEIVRIIREALNAILEWWRSLPRPVRKAIKARVSSMMRRKMRRYALVYARRN